MGKEMTARNEGCLRGLYRGEREGRVETEGEPNSRRCTPGLQDWLLLSCFHSFDLSCCQLITDTISFSLDLTVFMSLSRP